MKKSAKPVNTRKELAEIARVSEDTIKKVKVIEWIIKNQFGRRNLSNYERAKLALRLEPIVKEKARENMLATQNNKSGAAKQKSAKQVTTRKEIAKLAGVSHDTIDKVKVIENEATEEIKEKARKGEISVNKAFNLTRNPQPESEEPGRSAASCQT